MRIKSKINKLTIVCVVFSMLILLDYRVFYLVSYPNIFKGNSMRLLFAVTGMALTVMIYPTYKYENLCGYNKCLKYYFMCACSWMLLVLYSSIKYPDQPFPVTVVEHVSLLFIGFLIPVLAVFEKRGDRIFQIANYIVFIWYLLLVFQFIIYRKSGKLLFSKEIYGDVRTRFYGIRMGLGSFGNVMILYNANQIFSHTIFDKKNIFEVIQLILGMFCLVFVQQTRAYTLIVLVAVIAIIFWSTKKVSKKLFITAILFMGLIYLGYNKTLNSFFSSFSSATSNAEHYGTIIRLEAIIYYCKCFINNFFIGNGFTNYQYYPFVQYGMSSEYSYFYSDVGVFGLIGETGIFSLLFYIVPLIKLCKLAIKVLKNRLQREYAFFLGFVLYLAMTSVTLIITDNFRVVLYPVALAYGVHIESKVKDELKLRGRNEG